MTHSFQGIALAVVIPAWRSRFLGAALDSLRAQTDRRFRVYVGDDGSPDDIAGVVARHGEGLDVVYHRFAENLGGRELVAHWERCLALTRDEPWLWLFSDDDELEPGCVAAFYRMLGAGVGGAQLLRFNFKIIGAEGRFVRSPTPNPPRESAGDLLQAILTGGGREWRAPEHVFSRAVHAAKGGFVSLPRALYTDLATWVEFAEPGGVATIHGAEVRWRAHAQGVSSGLRRENHAALLNALAGFSFWLADFRRRHAGIVPEGLASRFLWRELGRVQPPVPWRLTGIFVRAACGLGAGRLGALVCTMLAIMFSRVRHAPGVSVWLRRRYRQKMEMT